MIKIESYLLENINNVIKENNNYGKINNEQTQSININLIVEKEEEIMNEINNIIYMDNLSRILNFNGYTVYNEIYIKEPIDNILNNNYYNIKLKYNNIKQKLDKYRITVNKISDKTDYTNYIEDIVTKYRYLPNCKIEDNSLYIELENDKLKIIDSSGEYEKILNDIAFMYIKTIKKYNNIVCIQKNYDKHLNELIKLISNIPINIKINPYKKDFLNEDLSNKININIIRYYFSNKGIDKSTYDDIELALKQSIDELKNIDNIYSIIGKILNKNKEKIDSLDIYNNINTELEYNILKKIYEFRELNKRLLNTGEPYMIINYLKELLILLNSYIDESMILDENTYNKEKINLIKSIQIVINNSLNMIGIIPIEQD